MAVYTSLEEEKQKVRGGQGAASLSYSDHLSQYNSAMDRLTQVKQNLPTYDKSYDGALQELFDEINNYEKFRYNSREDSLYQAYKQSYTDAGRLAMQDTMGQAAGLTGGYGSSYGQSVGQQQYNAYLQKLNDELPETYGMAYQQYRDNKNALQQRYDMTGQLAEDEYQKYQDRLSAYYREMDYWQDTADTAYSRYQSAEQQAYDRQQDAYQKQQNAYDRLADMIMNMGYAADADDLAAAGMKDREYEAYLNYFNMMNAPASGSSGGGGRRKSKKKTSEEKEINPRYEELLNQAKELIDQGGSAEEINSALTRGVGASGLTAEETGSLIVEITNHHAAKRKKDGK